MRRSEKCDPSKRFLYTASINCVITTRPVNLSVWFWSVEVHVMLKLSRILSSSINDCSVPGLLFVVLVVFRSAKSSCKVLWYEHCQLKMPNTVSLISKLTIH